MQELLNVFTPNELLLCATIILFAAILQMSIGMGFGMLASPLVALVKPEIIPGTILIMGLVVAFSGAWRERQRIVPGELRLGVAGRVVGSFAAFLILLNLKDINAFLVTFGIIMLIAVVMTATRWKLAFSNRNLFSLSVLSGLMGTITAVGAPPMALIYHNRPPEVVRPTLNAFFGAGAVLGIASLSQSGWLDLRDLVASAILLPPMLLGIWFSRHFTGISSAWLSRLLLLLSAIASAMLILRGL